MRVKPKEKYGKLIYTEPGSGVQLRELRTYKGKKIVSSQLGIFIGGRRNRFAAQEKIKNVEEGIQIIKDL